MSKVKTIGFMPKERSIDSIDSFDIGDMDNIKAIDSS